MHAPRANQAVGVISYQFAYNHAFARISGMNEAIVSNVDTYVGHSTMTRVEEEDVSGLKVFAGYFLTYMKLLTRRSRQVLTEFRVNIPHKAGTIKSAAGGATPNVACAPIIASDLNGSRRRRGFARITGRSSPRIIGVINFIFIVDKPRAGRCVNAGRRILVERRRLALM
jgi:hypothetical protein